MTKICGSTTGGLQTFGYLRVYKILPKDRPCGNASYKH